MKYTLLFVALFIHLLGGTVSAIAQTEVERADLAAVFSEHGVDGCMTVYEEETHTITRINPVLCDRMWPPASTFKIPHTLIALETGVVSGPHHPFVWDGEDRKYPAWNKNQTLDSAFRNSVVWVYEEIAQKLGRERIKTYLDRMGYGNRSVSGDMPFWLYGGLRISSDGQVAMLRRLYDFDLPFQRDHMALVQVMMQLEENSDYSLSGKTGWTVIRDMQYGWFIGWVIKNRKPVFFATHVQSKVGVESFGASRRESAKAVLEALGYW